MRVSEVALILESLASMILEWSLSCLLAKGVLLTITRIVEERAAIEGAAPRFIYRITRAKNTWNGSSQTPWMFQQKSPILSTSTLIIFIILPLLDPANFTDKDFL
jgi:hypothetical protein